MKLLDGTQCDICGKKIDTALYRSVQKDGGFKIKAKIFDRTDRDTIITESTGLISFSIELRGVGEICLGCGMDISRNFFISKQDYPYHIPTFYIERKSVASITSKQKG